MIRTGIRPYLLRKLPVTRPNQASAMDITYIPMAQGFVYLAVVVDQFSRKVLAWKLSITLETEFCLEAVEEALARYGKPEIFNTDQGSQFTSIAFTCLLLKNEIKISMDGKGPGNTCLPMKHSSSVLTLLEVWLGSSAVVNYSSFFFGASAFGSFASYDHGCPKKFFLSNRANSDSKSSLMRDGGNS